MIYEPVEVVIDKLVKTFRLKDWQYDLEELVEDIADALKHIGAQKIYAEVQTEITVNGYMAKLPIGLQNIIGLNPTGLKYRESGSFLEIQVADGTKLQLQYQGMPLDVRGYPLVPDNVAVREAIMWYLVKVLCLQREITVVSFEFADREWDWRCGSARADLNALSVQQVQQAYQNFVRLNPLKDQHSKNYEDITMPNNLDREKNLKRLSNP
jgi:hypothetical protein